MINRYDMLPCPFDGINPDLDAGGDWCRWTDVKPYAKLAHKLKELQDLNDKYNVGATEVLSRWEEIEQILEVIND